VAYDYLVPNTKELSNMSAKRKKDVIIVQTPIGKKSLDNTGPTIGAARMDPSETFVFMAKLLQDYINNGSESAWQEIRHHTDEIYRTVGTALAALETESPFLDDVKKQVSAGKRLFFKPNLVTLPHIDYRTHGPGVPGANSHWEFAAAVMRWFHDQGGITYHQMCLGEAGMTTTLDALMMSKRLGKTVTQEAIIEGKYGDGYGGWGFYFTRKYLADCHDPKHTDSPLNGYQESLDGTCLPPGRANDKLMVYNLNRPDEANSRDVLVADGINFKSVTLHKAVVGGDPNDKRDRLDWPGCVLINLPILKIHVMELLTCAVKNLGMGLFAMEAGCSCEHGKYKWKYTVPNVKVPLFKLKVPHQRWVIQTDEDTCKPLRDENGDFIWRRTGGMEANMADVLQAVRGQQVTMLHIAEAVECTNIYHSGMTGVIVPEGYVFASLDPVALDNLGARYLFNMVPLSESTAIQQKYGLKSDVIQRIPSARREGDNIVTMEAYDSCYSRYHALQHCEDRGIGQLKYHVVGKDLWQGGDLASLQQHLGRVENRVFNELITSTVYHASAKPLIDFQAGMMTYLQINDELTGADFKRQLLEYQDENKDGVIDYLESGKNTGSMAAFYYRPLLTSPQADPHDALKLGFLLTMAPAKLIHKDWNTEGYETGEQNLIGQAVSRAFGMSQTKEERPDPMYPGRVWGNGKWPSLQYVLRLVRFSRVYGFLFPDRIDIGSPYGQAFAYTDLKWNGSKYYDPQNMNPGKDVVGRYYQAVAGGEPPLPFTVYVPPGYGSYDSWSVPNIEETDDPALIFTAAFPGNETWSDLRLCEYPWIYNAVCETIVQ
jgi:hypothetical protein